MKVSRVILLLTFIFLFMCDFIFFT